MNESKVLEEIRSQFVGYGYALSEEIAYLDSNNLENSDRRKELKGRYFEVRNIITTLSNRIDIQKLEKE